MLTLFCLAERSFLGTLEQAVGAELRVMGKVRLADLVQPHAGLPGPQRMAALNRVAGKHVDFVLCDPRTLEALAVVELDDRSHQRPDRRERDAFVDGRWGRPGVPILHVPCRSAYVVGELREMVSTVVPLVIDDAIIPLTAGGTDGAGEWRRSA